MNLEKAVHHGDTEEIIEKNRILVISKKVKHNVLNI